MRDTLPICQARRLPYISSLTYNLPDQCRNAVVVIAAHDENRLLPAGCEHKYDGKKDRQIFFHTAPHEPYTGRNRNMKTTRIYFQDASFTDIRASDIQTDEFYRWLRFSSQRDTFKLPGMKQAIVRKDVARIVRIAED